MARTIVRRRMRHVQHLPNNTELTPQDPAVAEQQLLKSITASLTLAGFDGADSTALEMFRGLVEEYMLSILTDVREGMDAQRRATPTATDFSWALSRVGSTRSPAQLHDYMKSGLPEPISYPPLLDPSPALATAPDFSSLLQPLIERPLAYVPPHFPSLPSQHAWKSTPVFASRETDARKIREKATEEGKLAEGALRKLAAAAKASAIKADGKRRSGNALAGVGKIRGSVIVVAGKKRPAAEMMLDDLLGDIGAAKEDGDVLAIDGVQAASALNALEERVNMLMEVEEMGLDELLRELRTQTKSDDVVFNSPSLDRMADVMQDTLRQATKSTAFHPMLEINSPAPGDGLSQLLLHLVACAVLPSSHGGSHACVALFDLDGTLSASQLARQLYAGLKGVSDALDDTERDDIVASALNHVHVFRPQSLASTIATLRELPADLLHTVYASQNRRLAFIALTPASSFYWQARATEEDITFARTTNSSPPPEAAATYAQLTAALKTASLRLNSPVILTTLNMHPVPSQQSQQAYSLVRALRPSLPLPLSNLPTLKIIVQRQQVRKFPASLSVQEALREAADRLASVEDTRYAAQVNEWGMDLRTLERLSDESLGWEFGLLNAAETTAE
ncbi:hypothetical protein B0A48_08661 [Cryoendolithus antarcticus]|uniref:Transcription initiation factor TFIID subunit 8 n=1 Tax=Cryoendolithus antarcticus TaxID=1507870 RepID=A0A1V8T3T2_9PEZI|nr:hypothetical protein B0A48_08661 [Cryoendolithus antarcticus]